MSTKHRATKKPKQTGRVTKRKPVRLKKAISAVQARRLAARQVMARMFDGVPVQDGAEVKWSIFNVRLKSAWVVFPKSEPDQTMRLGPSHVVVVSKRTGRVLYDGVTGED